LLLRESVVKFFLFVSFSVCFLVLLYIMLAVFHTTATTHYHELIVSKMLGYDTR